MYGKLVSVLYVLNIVFQSFLNLLTPILLMLGLSWLLVEKFGAPAWTYAPLAVIGVAAGFFSMIKFILSASAALEKLEKERENNKKR